MKKISDYKKLKKSKFLAELIGIILGDGCLTQLRRTESLRITCNAKDKKYVHYVANLITKIFSKNATYTKRKIENAIDIRLYQKFISKRLGLPTGNKLKNNICMPKWIYKQNTYMLHCLKGIFDTDGHFTRDIKNHLHVIELTNRCKEILEGTFRMLNMLGFAPQIGKKYVRLARKNEVYRFIKLINFRNKNNF